ncbi:MAG TPA: PqiC family protein [Steroidobacteraceae bacterium]|nr:PqiC family protein [Steroidobacteraceae bacterium]
MKSTVGHVGVWASLLVAACASSPDHFYTLSTLPDTARGPLSAPTVHVLLDVTVPALVDRAEMVISTSPTAILILDHERWAAGLSDQVSQTLARDIEKRRPDMLIGDRGFDQTASPPVIMKIDIVRMSAQRGGRANIEAQWRIVDASAGVDQLGTASFDAPLDGSDYTSVAQAYSQLLSALAERLAGDVRRR